MPNDTKYAKISKVIHGKEMPSSLTYTVHNAIERETLFISECGKFLMGQMGIKGNLSTGIYPWSVIPSVQSVRPWAQPDWSSIFFRDDRAGLWESGFPKPNPCSAWVVRRPQVMSGGVFQSLTQYAESRSRALENAETRYHSCPSVDFRHTGSSHVSGGYLKISWFYCHHCIH